MCYWFTCQVTHSHVEVHLYNLLYIFDFLGWGWGTSTGNDIDIIWSDLIWGVPLLSSSVEDFSFLLRATPSGLNFPHHGAALCLIIFSASALSSLSHARVRVSALRTRKKPLVPSPFSCSCLIYASFCFSVHWTVCFSVRFPARVFYTRVCVCTS